MTSRGRSVREIPTRIVFWGPRASGKTETLKAIATHLVPDTCGPLLTPSDTDSRTLFMDFLSVEMGALSGIPIRLHLVGLPGDTRLSENALAVMRGADGFMFVADSAPGREEENRLSLASLRSHLAAIGEPERPIVVQLNRRDVTGARSTEEMVANLGLESNGDQWFETTAVNGSGVIEALAAVATRIVDVLSASAEERSGT